jgi:hypothetical protein
MRYRLKAVTLGALAAAAVLHSPTADATPEQDNALWEAQEQAGIPTAYNDPQIAGNVCARVWLGEDPNTTVSWLYAANGGVLTYEQSQVFVGLAIAIYCPPADTRSTVA